jgi:urea transporter
MGMVLDARKFAAMYVEKLMSAPWKDLLGTVLLVSCLHRLHADSLLSPLGLMVFTLPNWRGEGVCGV